MFHCILCFLGLPQIMNSPCCVRMTNEESQNGDKWSEIVVSLEKIINFLCWFVLTFTPHELRTPSDFPSSLSARWYPLTSSCPCSPLPAEFNISGRRQTDKLTQLQRYDFSTLSVDNSGVTVSLSVFTLSALFPPVLSLFLKSAPDTVLTLLDVTFLN